MTIDSARQETAAPNNRPFTGSFPPAYTLPPPRRHSVREFVCNSLFGDPKLLGMIHIMESLTTIAFGIIVTLKVNSMWDYQGDHIPNYTVLSGIAVWGPIIYLGTGIISIMTYRSTDGHLVSSAVYMNIFSCLIAATAVVLLTVDFLWITEPQSPEGHCKQPVDVYEIQGALLFFYILEFIVSVESALVIKHSAHSDSDPPLDPPVFVNEPLACPYLPISLPTQGIYTVVMPMAPPPEYAP